MLDRHRLKTDINYLASVVVDKMHKYDSSRRGVVSAAAFSRILDELGLEFGHREVKALMKYCKAENGSVLYNDLLPLAQSQAAPAVIASPTVGMREHIFQHTDQIRGLYANWDRGFFSSKKFKEKLAELSIPVNEELARLLDMNELSRNLPFSKVIQALQINDITHHKQRSPPESAKRSPMVPMAVRSRDIVTWREDPPATGYSEEKALHYGEPSQLLKAKHMISAFVDGKTSPSVFRNELRSLGFSISLALDRLIRSHESDNSTHFTDYVRAIQAQLGDQKIAEDDVPDPVADQFSRQEQLDTAKADTYASQRDCLQTPYAINFPEERNAHNVVRAERSHRSDGNGDIIGWQMQRPATAPPRHGAYRGAHGNSGDIISWTGLPPEVCPHEYKKADTPFGTDLDMGSAYNTAEFRPVDEVRRGNFR